MLLMVPSTQLGSGVFSKAAHRCKSLTVILRDVTVFAPLPEYLLEKEKATHSSIWPGEFHRLYSPWGCKESDTTEQLSLNICWKKWC